MVSGSKRLTKEDLERIFQKYVKGKHRVCCDEAHAHGIDCVAFDDEYTATIERLRVEVLILLDKLDSIENIIRK